MLVLFSHFVHPGNGWAGLMGVTTFFVLSGRLMSELLFIKQVRLDDFFVRRFNRVVPLFVLYVIAMAAYAATLQRPRYDVSMIELGATLAFLRTYIPSGMDIWSDQWPIGHLWSLNVEEHSYAYMALGALACSFFCRRATVAKAFLACSTLLVIAINMVYEVSPPGGASPWAVRSEAAALPLIAAAAIYVFRRTTQMAWCDALPTLLPLLTFLFAIACFKTYGHKNLRIPGSLALAFTVVFLDRLPSAWRALLSTPVLRWFGRCSFSLYVWQQPFHLLVEERRMDPMAAVFWALACGALSFYLLENPSRQWLNQRWHERRVRLGNVAAL